MRTPPPHTHTHSPPPPPCRVKNAHIKLSNALSSEMKTKTIQLFQAGQLKTDVSNLQSDLNQQTQEITSIKQGMIDLKNAIPVSELNAMNNIILLAINNGSLTTSQLQNLTQAITTITNKLALLNPPASSG